MRRNSKTMGLMYFGLAGLFIYFAIVNVNNESWNIWTFLFAGIAAVDVMIGVRFLRSSTGSHSKS
ncbi:YdiK family protein [Salibacterium sp. K-3]